jgi:hypothetical protein
MTDSTGHAFGATTSTSGTYTLSLPADVYTVTATARGYQPVAVSGIDVISGTIRTQDLSLEAAAVAVVEPPALAASLYPGERITHTLWLTNDGFAALTFTFQERGGELQGSGVLPWLSESPISGSLTPGMGMQIAVGFDAAGLEPGMEQGYLDLESNDPVAPVVGIPVALTVEARPVPELRLHLPLIVSGK